MVKRSRKAKSRSRKRGSRKAKSRKVKSRSRKAKSRKRGSSKKKSRRSHKRSKSRSRRGSSKKKSRKSKSRRRKSETPSKKPKRSRKRVQKVIVGAGPLHWRKNTDFKSSPKSGYFIHDNGGRPFHVVLKNQEAQITSSKDDYKKVIKTIPYEKALIGYHATRSPAYDGNSILLQIGKNQYVVIGESVKEFKTEEPVKHYHSFIGNSDVPYPYAETSNYYYLTLEGVKVAKEDAKGNSDPYDYYYFGGGKLKNGQHKKGKGSKFRTKTIIKRAF